TITDPVTIDGATQPGYADSPLIELNGTGSGIAVGLALAANDSLVRGLVINGFDVGFFPSVSAAIYITGNGNRVEGNYLGTDVSGTASVPNLAGVWIQDGANNTIGGTAPGARNIISGNSRPDLNGVGVVIQGAGATGNLVIGNYVGTDYTGSFA